MDCTVCCKFTHFFKYAALKKITCCLYVTDDWSFYPGVVMQYMSREVNVFTGRAEILDIKDACLDKYRRMSVLIDV